MVKVKVMERDLEKGKASTGVVQFDLARTTAPQRERKKQKTEATELRRSRSEAWSAEEKQDHPDAATSDHVHG